MKRKENRLIVALSEPLEWAEKGLDFVFVKTEQMGARLFKKNRKKRKSKQSKKDLKQKAQDQDLDVMVASNKADKELLKNSKERIDSLEKKQVNKEQEL